MALTVGKEELDSALAVFKIEHYYLEFDDNTVYLHWVATTPQAREYIDAFLECLDVLIDERWVDTYGSHERGNPVQLPDEDYICCRYILETV
jgi:hypothetical protein